MSSAEENTMVERITIELGGLTSPYLQHYAQHWGKSLDEAASAWLSAQAKSWEFKQQLAAELKSQRKITVNTEEVEAEEAQRAIEDWVTRWLSEAWEVDLDTLTCAYRALGAEIIRRGGRT